MARTVCGNCGSEQGPFDRLVVARKRHDPTPAIVTCAHGPIDQTGVHGLGTLACLARRRAQDIERWGPEDRNVRIGLEV